ncbi:hypothetical protein ACPA5B_22740 [Pseudomonas solani]|uniref:hypothetical protein n=1 Tax=Pseudomonas solani TaxID=2731552 RepID=UPI003C2AFC2D
MPRGPKRTRNKLRVIIDPTTGNVDVVGRPEWTTNAKRIKVNQKASRGDIEDRRHMVHWSQSIRKNAERVFSAINKAHEKDAKKLYEELTKPLLKRKLKRIPKNSKDVMLYIAKYLNSAPVNLVAGRADTNKAIEIVRKNMNLFSEYMRTSYVDSDTDVVPTNDSRMKACKAKAKELLPYGDKSSDIKAQVSKIQKQIVTLIEGTTSPSEVWSLIFDVRYSVTFDVSPNAQREATAKMLQWDRMMRSSEYMPADEQLDLLVSLADA